VSIFGELVAICNTCARAGFFRSKFVQGSRIDYEVGRIFWDVLDTSVG
jgi:hypothetical protein